MSKLLLRIRDLAAGEVRVDLKTYMEIAQQEVPYNEYTHPADWHYEFVKNKLFMIIYTHLGIDARKVILKEYNSHKCGFEAYRLLTKEYDAPSDDLEAVLMERVSSIATWKLKDVAEEFAAFREAETRLADMERRLNRTKEKNPKGAVLHEATVAMVTSMLYARLLSPSTKQYCMQKDKLMRSKFQQLKSTIEELKKLHENSRPMKMDIGSTQEVQYTHDEWVAWQDAGAVEEEYDYEYQEESSYDNSLGTVDAIKGKGKGKGYGNYVGHEQ